MMASTAATTTQAHMKIMVFSTPKTLDLQGKKMTKITALLPPPLLELMTISTNMQGNSISLQKNIQNKST
jgi:hypothetical protein